MRLETTEPRFGSLTGKRQSFVGGGGRLGRLQTHRMQTTPLCAGAAGGAGRRVGLPRRGGLSPSISFKTPHTAHHIKRVVAAARTRPDGVVEQDEVRCVLVHLGFRSHCPFSNRGTAQVRESGIDSTSGGAERQRGRARCPPARRERRKRRRSRRPARGRGSPGCGRRAARTRGSAWSARPRPGAVAEGVIDRPGRARTS
jgi:hypothetical protein